MIASDARQTPVTDYFEKDAAFWQEVYKGSDVFSLIHRERAERACSEIDRLPMVARARVLEVGCGAGLLALQMSRRGMVVEATDSTPAMIELTRRNARRAGVKLHAALADVHALPYPDAAFDVVVAMGVLPWLYDPLQALREMARVIRPGGHLITNTDNRARLNHLLDPLFNPWLQPVRRVLGRGRPEGTHTTTVWSHTFDRDLRSAGLEKSRGFTFGFGPFTFLGRTIVKDPAAAALHSALQQLADERWPILRAIGSQYMVVAKKTA